MLKNLTGRSLTLYPMTGNEPICTIDPSGAPARVSLRMRPTGGSVSHGEHQIPLCAPTPPTPQEIAAALPPAVDGDGLIVTAVVAPHAWAAGRTDVYHMGDAVFAEDGKTQIGARGLISHPARAT